MSVTGPMLARLARLYVDAINGGAIPAIRDSWTLLSEGECRASADAARAYFDNAHASQSTELSVVSARKVLRDAIEIALKMYDSRAAGPVADQLRTALAADMESRVQSALAEVKSRAAAAMRERLGHVESEVSRESTSIADVISAYTSHKTSMVETCGEESLAVWWPEAFPSLCRSVHNFSFRAEKKRHELQVRVDTAELEISKIKSEAEVETNRLGRELAAATQKASGLEERSAAAERRVDDMQRQHDLKTAEHASTVAELEEKIAALEKDAEAARAQIVGGGGFEAHPEEQTSAAHRAHQNNWQRPGGDPRGKTTAESARKVERRVTHRSWKSEAAWAWRRSAPRKLPHCRSCSGDRGRVRAAEHEATRESSESRSGGHAEAPRRRRARRCSVGSHRDPADAPKEGASARAASAPRSREKSKKATLKAARDTAAERASSYEDKIRQMEMAAVEREAHVREAKRLSEQECASLRGEIDRYTLMFQQQRESQEANRKEWLQQIQDMRTSSTSLMTDHKETLREHQEARRDLESKLATQKANNDALERRRKTLEDELSRSRQMLAVKEQQRGDGTHVHGTERAGETKRSP